MMSLFVQRLIYSEEYMKIWRKVEIPIFITAEENKHKLHNNQRKISKPRNSIWQQHEALCGPTIRSLLKIINSS